MAFSILEYLDDLRRSLEHLEPRKRLVFAAWCCEPLLQKGYGPIRERLGFSLAERIRNAIEAVWLAVESGEPMSTEWASDLRNDLELAEWADDSPDSESEQHDEAALSCIECVIRLCDVVEVGSSIAAAEAAERVINHLDYLLGQGKHVFEDPIMRAEIDAQRRMVRWLSAVDEFSVSTRAVFRQP